MPGLAKIIEGRSAGFYHFFVIILLQECFSSHEKIKPEGSEILKVMLEKD